MKTRERIKAISVSLFNEKGATNVSTVQIAGELGISPGNLYYYFSNKEHIIRSIWEEDMILQEDHIFCFDKDNAPEESLSIMLTGISQLAQTYSFFFAELHTLLQNDFLLQEKFRLRWDTLIEKFTNMLVGWEAKQYLRPVPADRLKLMAEDFLISGPASFQAFLAIHPEYSPKDAIQRSINISRKVIAGIFIDEVS